MTPITNYTRENPFPVSSITALAKQRLLRRCEEVCRRGLFDSPESAAPLMDSGGYLTMSVGDALPLEINKISLPEHGIAGSVPITHLLPPQDRTFYSDPDAGLVVRISSQVRDSVGRVVMVKKGEYPALIELLTKNGIVELQRERPLEINGVFGTVKPDDKQRLIIDARRANMHFIAPGDPELPHPGLLAQLEAKQNEPLWSAKIDVDNFYHRLQLPAHLRTYFGLPKVTRDDGDWFPVVRSLPMGWSHSVVISQKIHRHLLSASSLRPELEIKHGCMKKIGEYRYGAYIDDFFILGYCEEHVKLGFKEVMSLLKARKLPPKPPKVEPPSTSTKVVLGISIDPKGRLEPNQEKLCPLILRTQKICSQGKVSVADLESILGHWNWFALLQRSVFALMYESYLCLETAKKRNKTHITMTKSLRSELEALISVSPLLYADLTTPWGKYMVASDASEYGAGGVYTEFSSWHPNLQSLYHNFHSTIQSQYTAIPKYNWKIAIRNRWSFENHINILEGEALFLLLRWLARQTHFQNKKIAVHLDSQVIAYLVSKGRSSKRTLLSLARKVSALCLASNLRIVPVWIPSDQNPADGPSRCYATGNRQPQT